MELHKSRHFPLVWVNSIRQRLSSPADTTLVTSES